MRAKPVKFSPAGASGFAAVAGGGRVYALTSEVDLEP
jgi:hypothetical protein